MPSAIKGIMIECDPSIRALIVMMDSRHHDIILEELDETHLVVAPDKADYIKSELNRKLSQNVYNADTEDN